jgi:hypothetical protein
VKATASNIPIGMAATSQNPLKVLRRRILVDFNSSVVIVFSLRE